ncbi:MAG TPA: dihydrolipoyllysine-residue acetyltransferase [Woeseiaceae bacterium]|nr:dihydrolipoyllysine-residue acetyltransferase [Woeseiaceae bacterium]
MAKSIDLVVPDLGDFSDVEIIEILVASGDKVEREDGLITLETDKAALDLPAPESGVIESISVEVGGTVSSGDVIGTMSVESGDAAESKPVPVEERTGDTTVLAENGMDESKPAAEQTLVVPELGDFEDVEIIEVHIAPGDSIAVEDSLITLETDKAALDVPAVAAGTIRKVLVKVGERVSSGSPIALIERSAGTVDPPASPGKSDSPESVKPASTPATESSSRPAPPVSPATVPARPMKGDTRHQLPPINEAGFSRAHASPSVRKLARELGVDLAQVRGSGAKNRILKDDVKAFVKAILTGQRAEGGSALPKTPSVDFAKFGEIEVEPLSRIQKIAGPRLQASWINIPHVTQHDEADITGLEARRQELKGPAKEKGISLTPLAFILKACVAALAEFPRVNSSLSDDGEGLVVKKYCHLGFAADTDQGLMVPVIRDADKKDVYEIATELAELSSAARDGKLKMAQMQGATFTVSSLGGIGGTAFTPIVNAPEVAILGVSRSILRPVWDGRKFEPRLMLPLSLSYDHRVIDGAMAVRFTTYLGKALGDVDTLLQAIP